jgi:hypothetical protein
MIIVLEEWAIIFDEDAMHTARKKYQWKESDLSFQIKVELPQCEWFRGNQSRSRFRYQMLGAFHSAYEFTDFTSHVSATVQLNAFPGIQLQNIHL